MLMLGWALSAAIGALAGSLVAAQRTGFDSNLMQTVLVYALAAAALGGFDSLWGGHLRDHRGVADALCDPVHRSAQRHRGGAAWR